MFGLVLLFYNPNSNCMFSWMELWIFFFNFFVWLKKIENIKKWVGINAERSFFAFSKEEQFHVAFVKKNCQVSWEMIILPLGFCKNYLLVSHIHLSFVFSSPFFSIVETENLNPLCTRFLIPRRRGFRALIKAKTFA